MIGGCLHCELALKVSGVARKLGARQEISPRSRSRVASPQGPRAAGASVCLSPCQSSSFTGQSLWPTDGFTALWALMRIQVRPTVDESSFYRTPVPGEPVTITGLRRRAELNGARARGCSRLGGAWARCAECLPPSQVHAEILSNQQDNGSNLGDGILEPEALKARNPLSKALALVPWRLEG